MQIATSALHSDELPVEPQCRATGPARGLPMRCNQHRVESGWWDLAYHSRFLPVEVEETGVAPDERCFPAAPVIGPNSEMTRGVAEQPVDDGAVNAGWRLSGLALVGVNSCMACRNGE
jgi:hypothetical protein